MIVLKILLFPIKLVVKVVVWLLVAVLSVICVFYGVLQNYIVGTLAIIGGIMWIAFLGCLIFGQFDSSKETITFLIATCSVTAVPVLLFAVGEGIITFIVERLLDADDWVWNLGRAW